MKLRDSINRFRLFRSLDLILLFFIASVIIVLFVNFYERHQARKFAESKAMLLLDRNLATHFYFSQDLKPLLFDLLDEKISSDYFDPLWMSSTYAIRKIDSHFQNLNDKGYYYKECAVNARSPFNEADEYERAFIAETNTDTDIERRTAVRKFDGEPYLVFLRRGEAVEQSCLRCHSDAETAPKELIARYGKERGFGQKPGEYVSAISIRIPLSEAYATTTFHSVILSLFFVVLLLFVMAVQFILIRERKRAQRELDKRESLLKAIMEGSSDCVFVKDTQGRYLHMNKKGLDFLGKRQKDVIGKDDAALFDPETAEELMRNDRSILSAGESKSFEETFKINGRESTWLTTKDFCRDGEGNIIGVIGVTHDITERKRAEEVLRENEERIRLLFETVPHAVYECDAYGMITVANSAYSKISGYSHDEVVGMHIWDLMEEGQQKESLPEYLQELIAEQPEPSSYECRNVTKDGRVIDVEVNWDYNRDEGQIAGFVCILSDITERKRSKEEISNLAKFPSENPNPVLRISNEGVIVYANEASKDVLETWDCKVGEKMPAECYKRIEAAVGSGGVSEFEFECSNGHIFSATLAPIADSGYVNVYGLDITDRKEVEKKIERLAKFPAENPNPVFRIMRDGTILFANRASVPLQNAWGCRQGQKLEGDWLAVITKALNFGVVQNNEIEYHDHIFSLTFAPVVESGYVNVYALDITDLRRTEDALQWELEVNKALAHLSNVLNKPYYTLEEISDLVLAHVQRLTGSEVGFAGYIDEATGYLVCPTHSKMVWKKCQMQNKDIVFKEFKGILGWVLNEKQSVLTNSPADDPHSNGTPVGHIPIDCFVGAPSMTGDEVVGMLAVANAKQDYTKRDLWLTERLAEIYALAIQANRSQNRLLANQRQLQRLISNVSLAEERKRRRISKGMHEDIIEPLRTVGESVNSSRVSEAIEEIVKTTRTFASQLSFANLHESGLEGAIENWLAEEIGKKHGIETIFENGDDFRMIDEDMKHFLFEATRQLLTNTVEHAEATMVKVSLRKVGDEIEIAVVDDGIGFIIKGTVRGDGGLGLFSIRQRLRHLGGDMEIDSQAGKGTIVTLKVPIEINAGK